MDGQFNIDEFNLLHPDPTHSRLSRRLLKEKIQILESIVYQLDVVVFVHDLRSNRHIWTNGHYEKLIGYNGEEFSQMGFEEARLLFHPDDMELILEGINHLVADKVHSFSGIFRIQHKAGHWVWMYCQASIIQRDERGSPTFVLGIALDFSPHIQSERHLSDLINENRRLVNHIRLNCLTPREKEIIVHLTNDLTCKEISHLLGISYLTAETHVKNIHRKLGISHISALVRFAVESGLRS
jgi:PAS domain S-box-containing protein